MSKFDIYFTKLTKEAIIKPYEKPVKRVRIGNNKE